MLTPPNFSTPSWMMLRTEPKSLYYGLQFGDRFLSDCDFADDITSVCTSTAELEEGLTTLSEEAFKMGLKISWQKTKIMNIDPADAASNSPPFRVLGQTIELN